MSAFGKLAQTNNTLILPSNAGDITSLVGQAMTIYNAVSKNRVGANGAASDATTLSSDPITELKEQLATQSKGDSSILINQSHEHAKLEDFPKNDK